MVTNGEYVSHPSLIRKAVNGGLDPSNEEDVMVEECGPKPSIKPSWLEGKGARFWTQSEHRKEKG